MRAVQCTSARNRPLAGTPCVIRYSVIMARTVIVLPDPLGPSSMRCGGTRGPALAVSSVSRYAV